MHHIDHAASQFGWRFVELIKFFEISDLTGNDGFVNTFCAVAFKHVGAGTAVPLSADQLEHFVCLDVKLSRQLVRQIESVFLATRLFEHVEDFVGNSLFHKGLNKSIWLIPAFVRAIAREKFRWKSAWIEPKEQET